MAATILKRLLAAVPVLVGLSILVFAIMAMIPGDTALAILGSYATPENVARLNAQLGLDRSLPEQYLIWAGNLLHGDLGQSYILNRPVLDEVAERFSATLILAGTALVLASLLGIEPPEYIHVPLVLNASGERLAKRDGAVTMREMGEEWDVVKQLAASLGYEAHSAAELLAQFAPDRLSPDPYIWRG